MWISACPSAIQFGPSQPSKGRNTSDTPRSYELNLWCRLSSPIASAEDFYSPQSLQTICHKPRQDFDSPKMRRASLGAYGHTSMPDIVKGCHVWDHPEKAWVTRPRAFYHSCFPLLFYATRNNSATAMDTLPHGCFGRLASLLLLFPLFNHLTQAQDTATCYGMTGEVFSDHTPCFPNQPFNTCCRTSEPDPDVCLDTGLCLSTGGIVFQGGCTDPTGANSACTWRCPRRTCSSYRPFPGTES